MATASSHFLQLPLLRNPNIPFISPTRTSIVLTSSSRQVVRSVSHSTRPFECSSGESIDPIEMSVSTALRNANVLFFSSGYNVQIVVGEDEPEEVLLRRFRREVFKAGVILECKRRRFFENKHEEKKRKAREAARRNRRRRSAPRFTSSSQSQSSTADGDSSSKKDGEDVDDNWDMPSGDLPY